MLSGYLIHCKYTYYIQYRDINVYVSIAWQKSDVHNVCVCQVSDTHELSPSLRDSLRTVTSWKFAPKGRCYSAQVSGMRLLITKQILQKHFNPCRCWLLNITKIVLFHYFDRWKNILRAMMSPREQKSEDVCVLRILVVVESCEDGSHWS